jgi:hypothetical protein
VSTSAPPKLADASRAMSAIWFNDRAWLVKDLSQPRLSAVVAVMTVLVMVALVIRVTLRVTAVTRRWVGHRSYCGGQDRALDDFIEFPSVKPHAAALGAVVNFHTLPFRHDKVRFWADWAFHNSCSTV